MKFNPKDFTKFLEVSGVFVGSQSDEDIFFNPVKLKVGLCGSVWV